MIPYEFHGQNVVAYNLNPERADVEVLNDASTLKLYGFKVEGPGTAVLTKNGGITEVYGFSAGIGNAKAENALIFDDITSRQKPDPESCRKVDLLLERSVARFKRFTKGAERKDDETLIIIEVK